MYGYVWDKKTRGYKLTTQTEKFVANELRPVFAEELTLMGFDAYFTFYPNERRPLMWARRNTYIYKGQVVAKLNKTQFGKPPDREFLGRPCILKAVDVDAMIKDNQPILDALVADTLKRIKEMYEEYQNKCNITYIGFSGGKDSILLLDLCHRVLPLSVPVVFSDTDMELPDTYAVWEEIQKLYPDRPFIKVKATSSALDNWQQFGPPSRVLRWCCSVHKSTPAILSLRALANNRSAKLLAFLGVRGDESLRRSGYEDVSDGMKSQNQVNAMPIHGWGTHELFLYTFRESLLINRAYRRGLPRVGCLFCPMSSERTFATIKELYPREVSCFADAVRNTIAREFQSKEDLEEFVFSGGWNARQSGVSLNNVLAMPSFDKKGNVISCNLDAVKTDVVYEWLRTLGTIKSLSDKDVLIVKACNGTDVAVSFDEKEYTSKVIFDFLDSSPDKTRLKWIRSVINKSIGCVGCQACEAECPVGAISFSPIFKVDESLCIHCMKCHSTQTGCLRYFSKRYAGGTTMSISGINKYMNFGLKPNWISTLASERSEFRSTTALGNRMIPSAITWFREANLISTSSAVQPTKLLTIGERFGFDGREFWDLIWIGLVNNSPLMKWYVCNNSIDETTTQDLLIEKLTTSVSSASVRKGALQSLCNTLKESPIGNDPSPVVRLECKGKRVISLKRITHRVGPLVVLYSFYVLSQVSERSSFTISEMMAGDFESACVSPLVAFGIPVDEFKAQCAGLAEKYPSFIACSFTHGLDEIRIFPNAKKTDDVIGLILGE